MPIADWFSSFCDNLVIRNVEDISYRYRRITGRLNVDFWTTDSDTAHSLYAGSYGRNTGISGISDLDMLFRLPYQLYEQYNSHAGNGQSALLRIWLVAHVLIVPRFRLADKTAFIRG